MIVRTFSKAYGLAGVRVGYALSHPEVADAMNRVRPAFNVSNVAQAGAIAALADQAHVQAAARNIVAERERVACRAARAGRAASCPRPAISCWSKSAPRRTAYERLLRGGVIVRPVAGYGLPRHLRVSIGLPQQNDRLLQQLAPLLRAA